MKNNPKSLPGFTISGNFENEFPTEESRAGLGYEPFDLFLNDNISNNSSLKPQRWIGADNLEELIDEELNGFFLVFRYKKKDFDIESSEGIPGGYEEMPCFQREIFPVSVRSDIEMMGFAQLLEDTVEEVTSSSEYMFEIDMREEGETRRCKTVEEYQEKIAGGDFIAWPELYGMNKLRVDPKQMKAVMTLYQQEVKVSDYRGFSRASLENNKEEGKVNLDYDESDIDHIEDRLEREGFEVRREYLPDTVAPNDQ